MGHCGCQWASKCSTILLISLKKSLSFLFIKFSDFNFFSFLCLFDFVSYEFFYSVILVLLLMHFSASFVLPNHIFASTFLSLFLHSFPGAFLFISSVFSSFLFKGLSHAILLLPALLIDLIDRCLE